MKSKFPTLASVAIALTVGGALVQGQAPKAEPEMKTMDQKIAYALGLNIGKSMKKQGIEADVDLVARGIRDSLADKLALSEDELEKVQAAFEQQMRAKQQEMMIKQAAGNAAEADKNLKAGQAFLAANKAKPGVTTLPSGLQYKVVKQGPAGGKSPKLSDTVLANYRGTLIDGTKFDASEDRGGPAEFTVDGVIAGWTEILQKMKIGDKFQVFIPANLAYGPRGSGRQVPPNAALIFDIELVAVK